MFPFLYIHNYDSHAINWHKNQTHLPSVICTPPPSPKFYGMGLGCVDLIVCLFTIIPLGTFPNIKKPFPSLLIYTHWFFFPNILFIYGLFYSQQIFVYEFNHRILIQETKD